MADRPINYSTEVPVTRSVSECQQLLAEADASAVAVMYQDRKPVGLSFQLVTTHGPRSFTMPVNVEGAHKLLLRADYSSLKAHRATIEKYRSRANAERVAWRVVRDWLRAQLALISAGMASTDEVMLPYLQIEPQRTLYQAYCEHESALALTSGSAS